MDRASGKLYLRGGYLETDLFVDGKRRVTWAVGDSLAFCDAAALKISALADFSQLQSRFAQAFLLS